MSLFQWIRGRLHSGEQSLWKIECDALSSEDVDVLVWLMLERVGQFSAVEGVPRGGIRLADKLDYWKHSDGPLLIVDDVLTTGASMEEQRAGRDAIGYVIFARGPCPSWVRALFMLDAHAQ